MGARDTALCALIACRKEGAWVNAALKTYLARDRLDRRDAALATRLCYGVTQNRLLLDFYLEQLVTGKLRRIQPMTLDVLRLGLYQLYFMDKIPPSAVVNEAVSQVRRFGDRNAAGLVNAVLRGADRRRGQLREPEDLATRSSHPRQLVELLTQSLGRERLEAVLAADNEAPETVLQSNPLRGDGAAVRAGVEAEGGELTPHPWLPGCSVLRGGGSPERLRVYREGLVYVQDAASRLAVACAGLRPGMSVLDCCAAPGGKSMAAAIDLKDQGAVYAADLYPHKAELIEKNAKRLGLSCVRAMTSDASAPDPAWAGKMDAVLVDVPCSGLGIIRKKPDIRYRDLTSARELPDLQRKILLAQAECVKPGGVLLYSTCTLLRRENEQVVRAFLEQRPDFRPEALPLPEGLDDGGTGMLTLLPGAHGTDGFFICKLRRSE